MSDADATAAARGLARARWGNSAVRAAAAVVIERRAELGPEDRDRLRAALDDSDGGGDD